MEETPRCEPTCEDVARAAFIIGCLTLEGYVPLNLKSTDSKQDHMNAIQLTASLLAKTRTEPGESPSLPFTW